MTWIYSATIAIITLSGGTLLERYLMKNDRTEPIAYAIVFQFILATISLIIALLMGRFVLPNESYVWPYFGLAGVLWAGSVVFGFLAMKHLGAAEVTILGLFGTVITVFLSVVFLKNSMSFQILVGIFLILLAALMVIYQKVSFKSKLGVIYALLTASCASVAILFDSVILKSYESFSYMAVSSFISGFVLLTVYPRRVIDNKKSFNLKNLFLLVVFGTVYSIQGIAYYFSIESGAPLSQLSPLLKLSTVLTVILSAVFLNERKNLNRKILAVLVATVGAILVG